MSIGRKQDNIRVIPDIKVFVNSNLNFTIRICACCLAYEHDTNKKYEKPAKHLTVS